jgi:formylglycine-generating enzyme required for sulfatase activity
MKLVLVRGGTFQMGTASGDKYEAPVHQVTVAAFCLGAFEVTNAEWEAVMGPRDLKGKPEEPEAPDLPAGGLSYMDTLEFIHRLNEREERPVFRLPSEAEWELAAQDPGAWNCDSERLLPVGSLKANQLGLHGMLGNVWEWVEDWEGRYPSEPVVDPSGPAAGERRVRRGGAFDNKVTNCLSTRRSFVNPNTNWKDTGFRLARDLRR